MNFEKISDDILIFKSRDLSHVERQEVINEIYLMQDMLKPLGVIDYKQENSLEYQNDFDLVTILNYQLQLFAMKFFKENSRQLPNSEYKSFDIF